MILSLDPSINQTGYAIFLKNKIIISGVIKTQGKKDFEKLYFLFLQLSELIEKYQIKKIILEVSNFYSYKKHTNKFTNKPLNIKSLCKLNKAIAIVELISQIKQVPIEEYTPEQWKGNLNKNIIKQLTGIKNHNEAEAVLLGMICQK